MPGKIEEVGSMEEAPFCLPSDIFRLLQMRRARPDMGERGVLVKSALNTVWAPLAAARKPLKGEQVAPESPAGLTTLKENGLEEER